MTETVSTHCVDIEVTDDLLTLYMEEGFTYMHCTYYASEQAKKLSKINLSEVCYIINIETDERIPIFNTLSIPFYPIKPKVNEDATEFQFTLIFPYIPPTWNYFDLVEERKKGKGLAVSMIKRNDMGMYKIHFH
jgi:hypothetical protein